jgi:hypothetical protein
VKQVLGGKGVQRRQGFKAEALYALGEWHGGVSGTGRGSCRALCLQWRLLLLLSVLLVVYIRFLGVYGLWVMG